MKEIFLKSLFYRLVLIIKDESTKTIEIFLSGLSVVWSLWLLNPMWDTLGTIQGFRTLNVYFSDLSFGLIVLISGILHIASIIKKFYIGRVLSSLLMWFIWVSISTSMIISAPSSTGVPIYVIFSLTSLWIFFRLTIKPSEKDASRISEYQ